MDTKILKSLLIIVISFSLGCICTTSIIRINENRTIVSDTIQENIELEIGGVYTWIKFLDEEDPFSEPWIDTIKILNIKNGYAEFIYINYAWSDIKNSYKIKHFNNLKRIK